MANPTTYNAMPSVATSKVTFNSSTILSKPPEYADETKATAKVTKATRIVIVHFFTLVKVIGLPESSCKNSTT